MENNPFTRFLDRLCSDMALFESAGEMDDFLKKAVGQLMKLVGASLGAIFLHDKTAGELVFRAGYDAGDLWDSHRCHIQGMPGSFSLDGNEVGRAFQEGALRIVSYSYETREQRSYLSKIIVPFYRANEKIGVLLLAHKDADAFSRIDRARIMEAASLFGDRMSEALVLLHHPDTEVESRDFLGRVVLSGMKASEGVVRGAALPVWSDMETAARKLEPAGTVKKEEERFERSLSLSLAQLGDFQNTAASDNSEIVALIFTAQIYMLKDYSFIQKMKTLIAGGEMASRAVIQVIEEYAKRFASMKEERFAEKAQDVRDLGYRLISNMMPGMKEGFSYKGKIVLSRHIYPSDLFRLAVEKVSGLVLKGAGVTAHISILARSLDLPVLICDDDSFLSIPEGTDLLLDAGEGRLYVNPDEKDLSVHTDRLRERLRLKNYYTVHGASSDGIPVKVLANVNILRDAREAVRQGAEGIGLYRSEFPFILKNDFLSEEQQYRIYRSIVKSQTGKPVTLRTADIGGDKLLQGRSETESNPFLGMRGIRFSLANRGMFRDQLKAMLRAGKDADLGILFPMVSDVEEILQAKEEIALVVDQLYRRGESFNEHPRIGAMVELPSAAVSAAELASETDFLSIGTNDLIMYLLAVDRTNENLNHLYISHHPAVLSVLNSIARQIGDHLTHLSVCGDAASDPLMVPFLSGIGIRNLSVSPSRVEPVKQILNRYSIGEMEEISRQMLSIRRRKDMDVYVESFITYEA
jgi:phosphoenolpyruvate-protein phosphotransferase